MSKELIDRLREHAKDFFGGAGGLQSALLEAADALEAKAAPVGEREAFEVWLGIRPCGAAHDLAREAFKAGAAHQRQQAREVVMPERRECDDGYPSDDWLCVTAWNACLDEFARLNKGAGSHE